VTFIAPVQAAVKSAIPLDRLLLETDGPWMVPNGAPRDCKVCHSGLIPVIAAHIAQLKGVSVDAVLQATRANARKIYGI